MFVEGERVTGPYQPPTAPRPSWSGDLVPAAELGAVHVIWSLLVLGLGASWPFAVGPLALVAGTCLPAVVVGFLDARALTTWRPRLRVAVGASVATVGHGAVLVAWNVWGYVTRSDVVDWPLLLGFLLVAGVVVTAYGAWTAALTLAGLWGGGAARRWRERTPA